MIDPVLTLKPKHVVPYIWCRTNEVMSAYAEYERVMQLFVMTNYRSETL